MNRNLERRRDLIGGIAFVAFILLLIIGGFFLTRYLTSEEQHKKVVQNEIDKLKVDDKKDLVYYENETVVSAEPDIVYKDLIINLKEADTVNDILKQKMDVIRTSVKKISENQLDPNREVLFKEEDIYSANERDFNIYESLKYLSILVTDSEFSCYTGSSIKSQEAYTFSLTTGKRLSNDTLMGYAGVTIDDIKNKVREKLEKDQQEFTEGSTIYVDDTVNAINEDNLVIYTNKSGKVATSVVVKTNEDSYNDTIVLN